MFPTTYICRNTLAKNFRRKCSSEISDGNEASEITDGKACRKLLTEAVVGNIRQALSSVLSDIDNSDNLCWSEYFPTNYRQLLTDECFVGNPSEIWLS